MEKHYKCYHKLTYTRYGHVLMLS